MLYSLIRSGDSAGWIFEVACCEFYTHVKVSETTAHVFKRLFADVGMSVALVLEGIGTKHVWQHDALQPSKTVAASTRNV